MVRLTLIAVVMAVYCVVAAQASIIASIQPRVGSIVGGQLITITGSGFMRQGTEGTTVAYVGNNQCEQIEYYSTDSQYVCVAPVAPGNLEGTYSVQVVVEGIGMDEYAGCIVSDGCTYTYSRWRTSQVNTFLPAAGASAILPFNAAAVDASLFPQWQTKIGETWCDMDFVNNSDWQAVFGPGSATDAAGYLNDVNVEPMWTNDFRCFTHDQFASRTNFTVNILPPGAPEDQINTNRQGGGLATMSHSAYQVDINSDTIYNFETLPTIDSLSSTSGSTQGGAPVTVIGKGFFASLGCDDTKVTLAGQPCTLTKCAADAIECIPSAANTVADPTPAPASFPGTRGLYTEVWTGLPSNTLASMFANIATNSIAPDFTMTQAAGLINVPEKVNQYYLERQTGLFVPPYSANYQFLLQGNDRAELFLASDANTATVATASNLIASFTGSPGLYYPQASQISAPVALVAGQAYAIQLRHLRWGWQSQHVNVVLKMDRSSIANANVSLPLNYPSESVLRFHSLPTVFSVSLQSDVRREIQSFAFSGVSGGTFRVQYGTKMTSQFFFSNVSSSVLKDGVSTILSAASVCSDITVTSSKTASLGRAVFNITFNCPGAAPRNLLNIVNDGLVADGVNTFNFVNTRLSTPSLPVSGSFYLAWSKTAGKVLNTPLNNIDAEYTTSINFDASAVDVEQALLHIAGLREVDVSATGNALDGQTFTVTLYEPYGAIPLLQGLNNTLLGENARLVITQLQAGDSSAHYWNPLPGDFLSYASAANRVQVQVKGLQAVCNPSGSNYLVAAGSSKGDCKYDYLAASTPTITSLTPSTTIAAGTTLTIQGTGFSSVAIENEVRFQLGATGALAANFRQNTACTGVTVVSAGTITCTVPDLSAGSYTVQVSVAGKGLNAPNSLGQLTYTLRVDSISPASGSVAGGTLLIILGSGFVLPANGADSILINGNVCETADVTVTSLVCRTPAGTDGVVAPITINGATQTATFTYDNSLTSSVASIDQVVVSTAVTNVITISGSFGTADTTKIPPASLNRLSLTLNDDYSIFNPYSVHFGDRYCHVLSTSASAIVCRLSRAAPPDLHTTSNALAPFVYIAGQGYASNPNSVTLDIALRVHSLSANHGSLAGGLLLTITGSGFMPKKALITDTSVSVDPNYISVGVQIYPASQGQHPAPTAGKYVAAGLVVPCVVQAYTFTQVTCLTNDTNIRAAVLDSSVGLLGKVVVKVNNIASVCGGATDSVCEFDFEVADTPAVTSISPATGVSGQSLTITGTDLARPNAAVYIGHSACPITSNTATQIVCTVPAFTSATFPVYVQFADTGFAAADPLPKFTFGLALNSIDVTSGSVGGGSVVTISGAGFSPLTTQNVATVGGVNAYVVSATTTQLVILTPPVARSAVNSNGQLAAAIAVFTQTYYTLKDYFATDIVLANTPTGVYTLQATVNATLAGSFTYDLALTPTLTSVTPVTGSTGTVITIVGVALGASQGSSSVLIGGVACVLSGSWSSTGFQCTVGTTPAGQHAVKLTIAGQGLAATSNNAPILFTSQLTVTSFSPAVSGFGGGQLITIQGAGFSSVTAESQVKVCNARCIVQSATFNQLTCRTSPLVTLDRLATFGPTLVFPGQGTASGTGADATSSYASLFDGNVETGFSSGSTGCKIKYDLGNSTNLALTRIRFYPTYQKSSSAMGSTFSVSNDGINWEQVATITKVQEGWNYIDYVNTDVPNPAANRSFRYFSYSSWNQCLLQELEFQGYRVAALPGRVNVTNPIVDSANCPVSVQVTTLPAANQAGDDSASAAVVAASPLSYSLSVTPTVIAINPVFASALGGESITLTGTGFSATASSNTVALNDYDCAVQSASADGTQIICITSPRTVARPAPSGREISVLVEGATGRGYALLVPNPAANVSPLANQALPPTFRYLDRWSALTTWRFQEFPVDGDTVIIPQGQAVLLDVSPPRLFFLLIQGVLIWDNQDLALNSSYIYIQGGLMQIGTETKPFLNKATITLHGDRWKSIELPHYGSKCLVNGPISYNMVDGVGAVPINPLAKFGNGVDPSTLQSYYSDNWDGRGRLDMHGIPRVRTWTKVSSSALAGTSTLTTSEDVDFAPGEEVVITSHQIWSQTERRIVASLGSDKRTVTFTTPLTFDHLSEQYTIAGQAIDMRYEIGLLSRNIVVQGDDASFAQQFGGHIMSLKGGILRVENVELRHMGQSFNLGRYSIHFHLADQVPESYIRANSIHDAFQRAVTVHGSHYARVQNNVAAFIRGHTYFVEDGNEKYNVLEGNLGVHTTALTSMLRSDTKPATFWTSSPENFWRHNVAAGCDHDGYWLELPGNPGGPSYSPLICPVHGALGEFYNNTAHSNGVHGLRIYPTYLPLASPCGGGGASAPQVFRKLLSFHNGGNGIFGKENGDLHHVDHILVENGDSELSWVKLKSVQYGENPHVQNVLFIATPNPTLRPYNGGHKVGLWTPQDENFQIGSATFVNYGNNGAIAGCNECDLDDTLKQGGYTIRTTGLSFVNSAKKVRWTYPFKEIFFDMDGTLAGVTNSSVTYYREFNSWAECSVDTTGALDYGQTCGPSVRIRRMQFDGVTPQEFDWLYATFTQSHGTGEISSIGAGAISGQRSVQFMPKEIYGWVVPMVTQHYYDATWLTRMDWRTLRIRYSEPYLVKALSIPGTAYGSEWMGLNYNYTDYRYNFAVVSSDNKLRPWKDSPVDNTDDTGVSSMGNLYGKNGTWSLMVSAKNSSLGVVSNPLVLNVRALQCPLEGCPLPPPIQLSNLTRWSDPTSWPSGQVPKANEDVTISNTMNILYDAVAPLATTFGKVTVEGALTFEDVQDLSLTAAAVVVFGQLNIGTADQPFAHNAMITLTGIRTSPSVVVSNALFLGNKVLAVFGNATLYGNVRAFTATKLSSTLAAGSTTLVVKDAVDWVAGDEIVVSPTEYDSSQAESFKVVSVVAGVSATTITLDKAAKYSHFSGTIDTSSQTSNGVPSSLRLAASVGLLTRSITITSDLSQDSTYGGHVEIGEIPAENVGEASPFVGRITASFVDFRSMGQQSMENPALGFTYFPTQVGTAYNVNPNLQLNNVTSCAFSYGLNYGLKIESAPNVIADSNVLYATYRSAIWIDDASPGASITNNLLINTMRSPDATHIWTNPFAAIYVNAPVTALKNNVIGGSEDAGIVYQPEACGAVGAIVNNEVVAAKIGVWVLSDGKSACVQSTGFTAWKSAHIAFVTVDQTNNLQVDGITVSDSHIGVSLNFFGGQAGSYASIRNSRILGSTAASSDCTLSSICRAASATDVDGLACNSVFGSNVRRVGLMTSQYTNRGKTCFIDGLNGGGLETCRPPTTPERLCSLPWESRYGLPNDSAFGTLNVSSTTFGYFAASDCGQRSRAVAWNPTSRDFVPPMYFNGIGWQSVDADAKFDFNYRDGEGLTDSECKSGCDGLTQLTLMDEDGTAVERSLAANSKSHALLSNNVLLAKPGTACVQNSAWGAIQCLDTAYRKVVMENMDFDRGSRKLGPLLSTRYDASENRTDFSRGPIDDECPMRFFFGMYQTEVIPGNYYGFKLAGSNAAITRMSFRSADNSEAILLNFFYTQPLVLDVMIDDTLVTGHDNTVTPTLDSTHGSFQFSAQNRSIALVMRGQSNLAKQVIYIIQKPLVQVTLQLQVSITEFYGPTLVDNLSKLLSIDPSRIKIVSVQPGSTFVDLQVADINPSSNSNTEMQAQIGRLTALSYQLQAYGMNGTLNVNTIGYDLIAMVVTPPSLNGTVAASQQIINPGYSGSSGSSKSSFPTWAIAVICAVGGLALIVVAVLCVRSRKSPPVARLDLDGPASTIAPKVVEPIDAHGSTPRRIDVAAAPVQAPSAPRSPSHADDGVPLVQIHTQSSENTPAPSSPDSQAEAGKVNVPLFPPTQPIALAPIANSSAQWKAQQSGPSDLYRMGADELPEGHYICLFNYYPKFADELELQVGDTVVVLDGSSEIWYIGFNVRTGKRGSFPKSVVSRESRVTKGKALSNQLQSALPASAEGSKQQVNFHVSASEFEAASESGEKKISPRRVTHSRMDSSDDILVAQSHRELPLYERLPKVDENVGSDVAPPGQTKLSDVKNKHSGMDRQQSRH